MKILEFLDYSLFRSLDEKSFLDREPEEEKGDYYETGPFVLLVAQQFKDEVEEDETPYEIYAAFILEQGEDLIAYCNCGYFIDDSAMLLKVESSNGESYFMLDHEPAILYEDEQIDELKEGAQKFLQDNGLPSSTTIVIVSTM